MAQQYTHTPAFRFGGIDQRGDDLSRPATVADDSLNICPLAGADEKTVRQGYQFIADNDGNNGGFGMFDYNRPGEDAEQLIAGSKLFKLVDNSIAITYSGSGTSILISLVAVEATNTFNCTITVDDVEVMNFDLGTGYDEASIVTAQDLRDEIDGLTDFAATITGVTTHPAAFIPTLLQVPFDTGAYTINYMTASEVAHPTSAAAPFAGSLTNANADDFENISSIERNRVIYFANGYDEMQKYDGVTCYRVGAPKGALTSVTPVGSGAVGTGSWPDVFLHAVTVVQKDAQGNVVIGEISDSVSTSIGALSNFTVVLNNVLANTGFNTDCAVVAGAQSGVTTITVDNGSGGSHTMKVGQTAYFYDGVSAGYVERVITAVAATTITIAGANVNVADNAVISNNLRLRLYRTEADSFILNEVVDLPNNSFTATQSYTDSTTDLNLGASYDEAELAGRTHGLPPKFKYLATFKNLLIGLGVDGAVTTGYFSDLDSPEYWPPINEFLVESDSNEAITGGAENGPFFWVFKRNSIRQIVGDLSTGQYDITKVSDRIGCAAHATIKSYDNFLIWLGNKNFFASENGAAPGEIGRQLHRFFRTSGKEAIRQPVAKRAIGVIDEANDRALFFIPFESVSNNEVYANDNSRVIVFDFVRTEWQIWNNMNMAGGAIIRDDDMFWVERRFSTFNTTMSYNVAKRHNNNSQFDYVDHVLPISAFYQAGWVHGELPSVNKDFLKYKLFSNNSIVAADFSITCKTELDFIRDVTHSQTELAFVGGTGQWGIGPWGGFAWGSPAANAIKYWNFVPKSARALRPIIELETFFNQVVLTAWQMEVAPSHELKMKF